MIKKSEKKGTYDATESILGNSTCVGVGLREPHFDQLMTQDHDVSWVELLADNYLSDGGLTAHQVSRVAERYPLTLHCVGMNLGGVDELDFTYLKKIRSLMDRSQPAWISDHLCFTRYGAGYYHDLLPLPYTEEAVFHVAERIKKIQDFLNTRILVENVSGYIKADAPMSETEFLTALVAEADCDLLLDVNNLYVNQVNFGDDALKAMDGLPLDRVREVHLAGYEDMGHYVVDAHNNRVSQPVWELFSQVVNKLNNPAVLIEWDNDIPILDVLLDEMQRAKKLVFSNKELAA